MKRIYLIDCPGVVPPSGATSEQDILLRGVVRVENVENPAQYIAAILSRTQTRHIERTYEVKHAEYADDPIELLSILARKGGRLLKGGEPDVDGVAKMMLNDFLRGKIPWFTPPPKSEAKVEAGEPANVEGAKDVVEANEEVVEGREGRLGEMPGKRKRTEDELTSVQPDEVVEDEEAAGEDDDDDFESFDDDEDEAEVNESEDGSEKGGVEMT
jgi:nuclear GTP-binding protein